MSSSPYRVTLKHSAQKDVRALDAALRVRVIRALREFANEPRPHGCRKLVDSENQWRVRVSDYRIIYTVDDAARAVDVLAVRHRSKAYE
jgi:mRNA interferase RelE/StbE